MRKLVTLALASAALVAAPSVANARGYYGYSYGPSYGYSSYGYSYPSYGYAYPSYGYAYPSYGYSYPSYGYYGSPYRSYGYNNGVGAAVLGGVVGLALGAAIAGNHHHHHQHRYYRYR